MLRILENIKFKWLCWKQALPHLIKIWQKHLPKDIYYNITYKDKYCKNNKSIILTLKVYPYGRILTIHYENICGKYFIICMLYNTFNIYIM